MMAVPRFVGEQSPGSRSRPAGCRRVNTRRRPMSARTGAMLIIIGPLAKKLEAHFLQTNDAVVLLGRTSIHSTSRDRPHCIFRSLSPRPASATTRGRRHSTKIFKPSRGRGMVSKPGGPGAGNSRSASGHFKSGAFPWSVGFRAPAAATLPLASGLAQLRRARDHACRDLAGPSVPERAAKSLTTRKVIRQCVGGIDRAAPRSRRSLQPTDSQMVWATVRPAGRQVAMRTLCVACLPLHPRPCFDGPRNASTWGMRPARSAGRRESSTP